MEKAIIAPEQDAIVSEIHIAAPPRRVFQALTDAAELRQWFTDPSCPIHLWEMDARLGGRYRYNTESGTAVVNNVREFACHGEIVEFDPPRVLAYSWIANWHVDKDHATTVRWELTPTAEGTRVTVSHSGLANEEVARQDYGGGWVGVLQSLKNFAEGGD